jgi:hypothetical protein
VIGFERLNSSLPADEPLSMEAIAVWRNHVFSKLSAAFTHAAGSQVMDRRFPVAAQSRR